MHGDAQVSTDGQNVDAEVRQLLAAGGRQVFRKTASGAKTDRGQFRKVLGQFVADDVVTMTRLDRLARSTFGLFASIKQIVDSKAQFRSLAEPWADTGTRRLIVAVLGELTDVERDLIRTRTTEGHAQAKARGQHMGRPPKLTPQQQKEARRRTERATLKELAKSYNVGRTTISRLAS